MMSKGNSEYFTGTTGEAKALIDEVIANGDKITPENVMFITRDPHNKIIWLETGNSSAGFQHIIQEHQNEFYGKGITYNEIPHFIMEAVCQGNIISYQGIKNPRTIYEFYYKNEYHRIAIQIGNNGFIVSANLKSRGNK